MSDGKPNPGNVRQMERARSKFFAKAHDAGVTVLGDYVSAHTPVLCICRCGERFSPRPIGYRRGGGCFRCGAEARAAQRSAGAEIRFRALADASGVQVLGDWVNIRTPILCRCTCGAEFTITAKKRSEGFTCPACRGRRLSAIKHAASDSEAVFRAQAAQCGVEILGPWRQAMAPIRCRCRCGSIFFPTANSARTRGGVFRCVGCSRNYDTVYLVRHPSESCRFLKVGIALEGGLRIRTHERRGWTLVHSWSNLTASDAKLAESKVIRTLRAFGFDPLPKSAVPAGDGATETFHESGLGIALDVLESCLLFIPPELRASAS